MGTTTGLPPATQGDSSGKSSPSPNPGQVDEIAAALRVLAKLRSRSSVRDRPLSPLDDLLDDLDRNDRERRFHALEREIDAAISRIAAPEYRRSAELLLGSGSSRWRPLAKRGADAGAVFGVGWDSFRRERAEGPSLRDETILAVATELAPKSHRGGDTQPPATESPGAEAVDQPPSRGRRRRQAVLAGLVLVAVIGVGVAVWPDRSIPAVECFGLTHQPGDVVDGAPAELKRWAQPFAAAAAELPAAQRRCASLLEARYGRTIQRIGGGNDAGAGALVGTDATDEVVWLAPDEYTAMRVVDEIAPPPDRRLGDPLRRSEARDDLAVVEFTNGAIISPRQESPAFVLVGNFWRKWDGLGGLDGPGRPLTHAYDRPGFGRIQEFESGTLIAGYERGAGLDWIPNPDPGADLPEDVTMVVITATDRAVSWFIDADSVAHWLPTGTDATCALESHDAPHLREVPAATIATLPLGEPFRCR